MSVRVTEQFVPEWIDRRTAEWCAQICDALSARLVQRRPQFSAEGGARACAENIRALVAIGKPALPALTNEPRQRGGS
jgi:hypothetical protein